jgi:hypothetical protein
VRGRGTGSCRCRDRCRDAGRRREHVRRAAGVTIQYRGCDSAIHGYAHAGAPERRLDRCGSEQHTATADEHISASVYADNPERGSRRRKSANGCTSASGDSEPNSSTNGRACSDERRADPKADARTLQATVGR